MAVTQQADLGLWDQFFLANGRGALQRRVGGGKLRVNAALDYSDFDRRQDVTILAGAGADVHNRDRQKTWSGELGATWTRPLGPRSELELTALQRATLLDDKSHSDFGGALSTFGIDSTASESIARGIWRYRPSNAWAFEGGGEVAYNSLDSDTAFTQAGVAVPLPNAKVLVTELRGEIFGQATWRASGKLTIEAALRGEVSRIAQKGDTNASKSFLYPKPRLQIAWQPSPRHQLRFRVEERVGQLDFGDFAASTEVNLGTVVGGNADLVPQRDTLIEGVYEFRFWGKSAIELTGQHDLVRGIIDVIPLAGGFEAVGNIGSGTSDFAQARVTLPLDRIGIRNGLLKTRASWAWTRATDPLTGERRRFSGSAPFTCSAEFTHDLKGGRFSYGVVENCGRHWNNWRVREVRLTEMQGFLTAWGQWKPRKDLTVRLEVGNLLDTKLRVTRDIYPGARDSTALAMREVRETQQGRYAYLQVRKSL
jgi:outer membrane receptor protein involved in Fe transport